MDLEQIGSQIRRFRLTRGLTQAQLAAAAKVTRTTLNQLENGTLKDLGLRKVSTLLRELDLELDVTDVSDLRRPTDFLRLASTTASVSFKEELTEKELLHALMTGKVPPGKRAHIRTLLEEAPREILEGVMRQVNRWARPGKVEKNLARIADALSIPAENRRWPTNR